MGYRVLAPLVYLRVPDVAGALVSYAFYAGAPVPDNVDKESLKHNMDSGLVVKEDDPLADVLAVPAGTPIPGEPPNVPVTASMGGPRAFSDRVETVRKSLPPQQRQKSEPEPEKPEPKPEPGKPQVAGR